MHGRAGGVLGLTHVRHVAGAYAERAMKRATTTVLSILVGTLASAHAIGCGRTSLDVPDEAGGGDASMSGSGNSSGSGSGTPMGSGSGTGTGGGPAMSPCGDTSGLQAGAPWPMVGRCPTRMGRSASASAQTATKKWTVPIVDPLGPVVAADGTIYVAGTPPTGLPGGLFAVNPDGTIRWFFSAASDGVSAPAIGADGTVYFFASSGFYGVTPAGHVKCTLPTADDTPSGDTSPVIDRDGTVYASVIPGISRGKLRAIHPDCTLKWALDIGNYSVSRVAIDALGTLYMNYEGSLHAMSPVDGSTRWTFPELGEGGATIGADGTVYFAGEHLHAFRPDGAPLWSFDPGQPLSSASPALGPDGTIYAGSPGSGTPGHLFAVHPDGSRKWSIQTSAGPYSPVVGADGLVYAGSSDWGLTAVSGVDGAVSWTLPAEYWVADWLAIGADGTLYFASRDPDGALYAIGP